jgi:fumarylpyruvate hydrolase
MAEAVKLTTETSDKRLFDSPLYPVVPVLGEQASYPVHRIFCVGRNYADHAKEMGVEVDREAPFYFLKDAQAIVQTGATVAYPSGTSNYHYEMELVIAIGRPVFRASAEEATAAIYGYAAGLDMTRRDLQLEARAKQRPWDLGKNFEKSAVMAPITKAATVGEIGPQRIRLSVGETVKQDARLADLVWTPTELVTHLSKFYHLTLGDLIYTGTPAGVGPVIAGDSIVGEIDGLTQVTLTIGGAE